MLQTREEFQAEHNDKLVEGFNSVADENIPSERRIAYFHSYVSEAYIAYVELMIQYNLTGK